MVSARSWAFLGTLWLFACESSAAPETDASLPDPEVLLGTPDPVTGLDFVPFADGDELPLETFGQGGTHVTLAVRCIGFGNRAFVDITLRDPATGASVTTPESINPKLLACLDEAPHTCELVPMFVMTGGLADPEDKDGLEIEVAVTAWNNAGAWAEVLGAGVLRMH